VPWLLGGLDVLERLARGEGMPHVIAEAGAARRPMAATPDNGVTEQVVDVVSDWLEQPTGVHAGIGEGSGVSGGSAPVGDLECEITAQRSA
jgi:polysaccharide biosynthesis protein PelF